MWTDISSTITILLTLLAVLVGFWMGRKSVGMPVIEQTGLFTRKDESKFIEEDPYEEALRPPGRTVETINAG